MSSALPLATPLAHTDVEVTLTDLVAEYVLRHHFRNAGTAPIEAVFSIPVPLDAAFLGMQATMAGETLVAQIQPQQLASRTYGDAIAQGHSGVLLRNPEPGVLCISLGNLLPNEEGVVELRFAAAVRVADRSARFSLPLVHRPRYGTWNLEELEAPTHDFGIEHPLAAKVRISGLLASAPVTSSIHAARTSVQDGVLVLELSEAQMDRDLVLAFDLPAELRPSARLIADGARSLGLVTFVLPHASDATLPMDLCLVLDCSGSMNGDAIQQSRAATLAVASELRPEDRVQVLRFGSSMQPFFRRPMLATARVCQTLRELIPTISANLRGTEMGSALGQAIAQLGPIEAGRTRVVILVTDGAVQPHDVEDATSTATTAGVRLFVVAVGSSAGTEVLGPLADVTGGTLERAVPSEPIDAGVMRQFRRARQAGPVPLRALWPDGSAEPLPAGNAYAGDAVELAASLSGQTRGAVTVSTDVGGFSLRVGLGEREEQKAIRALCGMKRHASAPASSRESLALEYGLLTAETSAVLVNKRAEGVLGSSLPVIVQVPQMLPEGMIAAPVKLTRNAHAMASVCVSGYLPPSKPRQTSRATIISPTVLDDDHIHDIANSPALSVTQESATAMFDVLYPILRSKTMDASGVARPLGVLFRNLPVELQPQAIAVMDRIALELDEPRHSLYLLDALTDILGMGELDESLEIAISLLRVESQQSGRKTIHWSFSIQLRRALDALLGR